MTHFVPIDSGGFIILFTDGKYSEPYRDFVHAAFTVHGENEVQAEYRQELLEEGDVCL